MGTIKKIERDYQRFKKILKGKVRRDLKKYIKKNEMWGLYKGKSIRIPIGHLHIPRFRYGWNQQGGVGQGEGDEGDIISVEPGDEAGKGSAGNSPGGHVEEVELEMSLDEFAAMLGEELELPNIEPRGKDNLESESNKLRGIAKSGIRSLVSKRRTYKEALKRSIMVGEYNPQKPTLIPIKGDFRYRSLKKRIVPEHKAVIIWISDISGSMMDEERNLIRQTVFLIETWLKFQYKSIEQCYVVHDTRAVEVPRDLFYSLSAGGGTKISPAYQLVQDLINTRFPVEEWNIYCFHFSDGENWSGGDDNTCQKILVDDRLLDSLNLFGFARTKGLTYNKSAFNRMMDAIAEENDSMIISDMNTMDDVIKTIKDFLGKGK